MQNPAQNEHPIHELLQARWSPRAFSNQQVEPEKLLALFEAARWSPSGGNSQPWSFIVVTQNDREIFDKLVNTTSGRNMAWSRLAPVLVLTVAKPGRPGTPIGRYSYYDAGQSVAHLSLQASALGLYVHQMAGFDNAKVRELFQLPAETEPMTLIAIGYYGDAENLPQDLRERETMPRTRKPLSEFVYGPQWGAPLQWPRTEAELA
ncbi:MAG TPA: nitroreductase family protein [Anaerolineae bacterium]|jgi:nitroreductase